MEKGIHCPTLPAVLVPSWEEHFGQHWVSSSIYELLHPEALFSIEKTIKKYWIQLLT